MFSLVDSGELRSVIAAAVLTSAVTELRELGPFGLTCMVPITVTIEARTAQVRTIWHYEHDRAAPRLVTASPHLSSVP